eukprot:15270019-Alexandrium_andersonii.AAC.1
MVETGGAEPFLANDGRIAKMLTEQPLAEHLAKFKDFFPKNSLAQTDDRVAAPLLEKHGQIAVREVKSACLPAGSALPSSTPARVVSAVSKLSFYGFMPTLLFAGMDADYLGGFRFLSHGSFKIVLVSIPDLVKVKGDTTSYEDLKAYFTTLTTQEAAKIAKDHGVRCYHSFVEANSLLYVPPAWLHVIAPVNDEACVGIHARHLPLTSAVAKNLEAASE